MTAPRARSETAPEDRIPFLKMGAYGAGGLANNLLAAGSGGMMIALNLGYGMNPALVGLLGALPRLTDAITDPVMGHISDHTRSRWGRRRPYILFGAIAAPVMLALLWQLPEGRSETFYFNYFLIGSLIFYLAYTVFATPWVALGYELTPDYNERTRLMGVQNFIAQGAWLVAPWFLLFMELPTFFMELPTFGGMREGAASLAIVLALACAGFGILPALFLRERYAVGEPAHARDARSRAVTQALAVAAKAVTGFIVGFGKTLGSLDFLKLCGATFLVFNGFQLIAAFQAYLIIFYVFGGDQGAAAIWIGYVGMLGAVTTFGVILLTTLLGTWIGKRRAFFVCIGISTLGYGLKWFCYDPANPWLLLLPAPLMAFGLGSLFTLMGSMIADVCDQDELKTGERREGMYGAIFWWVVKLGMAAALATGGFLLNATGFDVDLGGAQSERTLFLMRVYDVAVPLATSLLAMLLIASYGITEAKAREIRATLEERRGVR